jgi:bifunctional oligoribonuclease and PAP phosphatase NrnA
MQVSGATWGTTMTVPELAAWLKPLKRVVVLTHVKPDGDAIGSTLAVTRALNLASNTGGEYVPPKATPWYWGPLPDWFAEVVAKTEHRLIDEKARAEHDNREEPDGVLILDTGTWTQLHEVREWLLPRTERAAVLDHHQQGDPDIAGRRVVITAAAAVCEPAAELCRLVLGAADLKRLPREVANPLYMGLATDTGWFRHSNVTPAALRTAADLLEAGADHAYLYEMIERRDRPSRLRLLARALSSMELFKNDSVALMTLTQQDFHDCRATPTDSGGFADVALGAASVKVCAVITEAFVHEKGNITKVSFRSKEGPAAIDVNEVAKKLSGGGHIRAAGAKVSVPLADARKMVLGALGV